MSLELINKFTGCYNLASVTPRAPNTPTLVCPCLQSLTTHPHLSNFDGVAALHRGPNTTIQTPRIWHSILQKLGQLICSINISHGMANVHSKALSNALQHGRSSSTVVKWNYLTYLLVTVTVQYTHCNWHRQPLSQLLHMLVISVNYCNSKIPLILNICKCNDYMLSFREAISG